MAMGFVMLVVPILERIAPRFSGLIEGRKFEVSEVHLSDRGVGAWERKIDIFVGEGWSRSIAVRSIRDL